MDRLAIDLGTSNTVAVLRGGDGHARPVLFDGREQLPSAVHATPGGDLVAGHDAERLARADPASFEPNPKRRVDDGTVLLGAHRVAVADALATVLATVAERAGPRAAGAAPVVLTVPAGWGAPRRQVLLDAAARAGLGTVDLVSEPVAAAAYLAAGHGEALPPGAALLVVDAGAGTTDLAVVRDGRVVAQDGLDVGGLDIDAALVGVLGDVVSGTAPDAWHRLDAPATAADRADRLLLWQEVRAAKESLSRLTVAPIHVPGCPAGSHLTRDELVSVAAPLLAPVADLAGDLARSCGDVGGVFLVGGGSRLPLLASLLHARLGVAPTTVERPETVVAEGALHAVPPPAAGPVPAAPDRGTGPVPRTPLRRRWRSPATVLLALLCFALPFATVSCGLPDGYGRARPGGSTEYTGYDLATGGAPRVRPDQLRPAADRRPDRLAPQAPHVAALLLLVGVLAATGLARDRRRRVVTAALAGAAVLALAAGQLLVTDRLAAAVAAQSRLPDGRTARDMVGTGAGFWLTVALLTALAAANAVASVRSPRRGVSGRRTGGSAGSSAGARARAPGSPPTTPTTPGRTRR